LHEAPFCYMATLVVSRQSLHQYHFSYDSWVAAVGNYLAEFRL
jgi:hypothetical protein